MSAVSISPFKTISDLVEARSQENRIPISCSLLDSFISPCLRSGHVVEVAGEAGSGKTQWALQLSVYASIAVTPERKGVVIFIATEGEGPFPSGRLKEMVDGSGVMDQSSLMDRIIIETVQDMDQLSLVLGTRLGLIAKNYDINLLVLDSIAGTLRTESETPDRLSRSILIHKIGHELNDAAKKYKMPVIVINQVTAYLDQAQNSYGRSVVPCFGLAFANYVHTRIFIERSDSIIKHFNDIENPDSITRLRTATIDFSPVVAPKKICFLVQTSGIRGVNISKT